MSENQKKPSPKKGSASTKDHGQAQLQAQYDAAEKQGYWGTVPDETPNEAYTVPGVIAAAKARTS